MRKAKSFWGFIGNALLVLGALTLLRFLGAPWLMAFLGAGFAWWVWGK